MQRLEKRTYLLDIRRQQTPLVTLGGATADLPHKLIQLLLVEDPIALSLELISGRLGQRRLAHDTASNASSATVGGSTGADTAHVCDGSRHLRGLLWEDLGDGQLALQRLLAGLNVLAGVLRDLIRVRLLLGRADDAGAGARGGLRGRAGLALGLLARQGDAACALVGDREGS